MKFETKFDLDKALEENSFDEVIEWAKKRWPTFIETRQTMKEGIVGPVDCNEFDRATLFKDDDFEITLWSLGGNRTCTICFDDPLAAKLVHYLLIKHTKAIIWR